MNGNAQTDTRNQITNINYNLLNLPRAVTRTPGNISYVYDATGEKLQKISGGNTRDYVGNIEYNNGALELVKTEEGRATFNGSSYIYEYYLKDHLGNTRASLLQDGTITQVQDYYAFGVDMNPGNAYAGTIPNNYKYNGKEKQAETGQYDYGARFYDPVIARWTSVDPLVEAGQESTSPYGYVFDDPIRFKDPDGKAPCDPPEDNDFLNYSSGGDKLVNPTRSAIHDFSVGVLDFLGVRDEIHVAEHLGDRNVSTAEKAVKVVQAVVNLVAVGEEGERIETNEPKVFEPYNRQSHYGKTPTAADRAQLGADKGTVVDHDPSLVKRY